MKIQGSNPVIANVNENIDVSGVLFDFTGEVLWKYIHLCERIRKDPQRSLIQNGLHLALNLFDEKDHP